MALQGNLAHDGLSLVVCHSSKNWLQTHNFKNSTFHLLTVLTMALTPNNNNANNGGCPCNMLTVLGVDFNDNLLLGEAVQFVKERRDKALQFVNGDLGTQ